MKKSSIRIIASIGLVAILLSAVVPALMSF